METFVIDVPIPSMGATVNELNVIAVKTQPGERVAKGQRIVDLESDKSVFEFESPCDGVIRAVRVKAGDAVPPGAPFLQIETADESLRHLMASAASSSNLPAAPAAPAVKPTAAPIWTPRATKLLQEAGIDPATVTAIEATGPGGRVSGDDVVRYLAARKA